jgi:hypothetical protein
MVEDFHKSPLNDSKQLMSPSYCRFLRTKKMPSLAEGFTSVHVCKSDGDVRTAMDEFKTIGALTRVQTPSQRGPVFSSGFQRFRPQSRTGAAWDLSFGTLEGPGSVYASDGGAGSRPVDADVIMEDADTLAGNRPGWGGDNGAVPGSGFWTSLNGGSTGSEVDDPMEEGYAAFSEETEGRDADTHGQLNGERLWEAGRANGKRKLDDVSAGVRSHGGGEDGEKGARPGQGSKGLKGRAQEGQGFGETDRATSSGGGDDSAGKGLGVSARGESGGAAGSQEPRLYRLAFPSISTADFMFDHQRAADVIVEEVSGFLGRVDPGLHLMLVDLSDESDMVRRVRGVAKEKGLEVGAGRRFEIRGGNITKLRTGGGAECQVIANATNWYACTMVS